MGNKDIQEDRGTRLTEEQVAEQVLLTKREESLLRYTDLQSDQEQNSQKEDHPPEHAPDLSKKRAQAHDEMGPAK